MRRSPSLRFIEPRQSLTVLPVTEIKFFFDSYENFCLISQKAVMHKDHLFLLLERTLQQIMTLAC